MKLRLIPESLFGRLLAALLIAVGISLLFIVGLLLNERRELLSPGSEISFRVSLIQSTVDMLADLPADQRAEWIERRGTMSIFGSGWSRGRPQAPPDPAAAARTVQAELARALGGSYRVAVTPAVSAFPDRGGPGGPRPGEPSERGPSAEGPGRDRPPPGDGPRRDGFRDRPPPDGRGFGGPELDVAVTFPGGEILRHRMDVPRAPPPLPVALLAQLALVTLVLGAVLYAMARTITRPLAELSAAAEAVGRGGRHLPLREVGARELREATRAFNTMQERLHRYLDSRTRVLAAMSHDLRTPLTRLKLRTESLDDDALRDKFNADLDEMQQMVAGALNLFRGMNHDEPLKPVDIGALVEEIRSEFAEMGIAIDATGASIAPVLARPSALKRCLTNLVSNAAKYGAHPSIAIDDGEGEVAIRVRDDGPGVPADMLEQVFEPFFRLEGSRSIDTGGVGLGLSIARDIAQGHGGSLTLQNRSPHGLEGTLRLPRAGAR